MYLCKGNGGKSVSEEGSGGAGPEEPLSRPSLLRVPSLSAADLEVMPKLLRLTLPIFCNQGLNLLSSCNCVEPTCKLTILITNF